MDVLRCQICGEPLKEEGGSFVCRHCGFRAKEDTVAKMLEALSGQREEDYYRAKRLLFDAIRAPYPSKDAVISASRRILSYDDMDAFALVCLHSHDPSPTELIRVVTKIQTNQGVAKEIIGWLVRQLDVRVVPALLGFVDRHFVNEERTHYRTLVENEVHKAKEGFYRTDVGRDVFICYSSADMKDVERVLYLLESNGFDCFAAFRNLRHGAGAAENYLEPIKEALRNCKVLVFLSSTHSRDFSCDALAVELVYLAEHLPGKERIEYLIDDYGPETPRRVIKALKAAFPEQEQCRTEDDLIDRVEACVERAKKPKESAEDMRRRIEKEADERLQQERRRYEEETRSKFEAELKKQQEKLAAMEEERRKALEEAEKKRIEEEARKKYEEQLKKQEAALRELEETRKKEAEEAERKRIEEEARQKYEAELAKQAEKLRELEEQKQKRLDEAKRIESENNKSVEEDKRLRIEEEIRQQYKEKLKKQQEKLRELEEERKKEAEEEEKRRLEEEIRQRYEEKLRQQEERLRAFEEERQQKEKEAERKRIEEQARQKYEAELLKQQEKLRALEKEKAKLLEEESKRKAAEEEKRKKTEEEIRKKEEEASVLLQNKQDEVNQSLIENKICPTCGGELQEKYGMLECKYCGFGFVPPQSEESKPPVLPGEDGKYCYEQGQKCRVDHDDSAKAAEWYLKGAIQGEQKCQYHLGRLYDDGEGVPQDYAKAADYYQKAANGKDDYYARLSKGCLAGLYERGQGVAQSYETAAKLYEEAKDWTKLGLLYQFGDGVPQSFEKAAELYRRNVGQGQWHAKMLLGFLYETGLGVPQSYEEAMKLYQGAPYEEAYYRIGEMYYEGKGVPLSKKTALEYYQKAAEKNYADAFAAMANVYRYYIRDPDKAKECAKKALELDSAREQTKVGSDYENGYNGMTRSQEKAMEWYKKAAEKNYPDAFYHLAFRTIYGYPSDPKKSFQYALRAACGGHAYGQYMVGKNYEDGDVVPQSYKEAALWYERATNNGHPSTGKILARFYEEGLGVSKDKEKANYWMSKFRY